ncbi:MAG: hypothetical protein N4A62_00800 [Marinisporobacter sp.]|nr:hypothetical protein [Marinisporobacter sp.]
MCTMRREKTKDDIDRREKANPKVLFRRVMVAMVYMTRKDHKAQK